MSLELELELELEVSVKSKELELGQKGSSRDRGEPQCRSSLH
jgi:hypothetical protein